jgi:lysozyme
MMRFKHALALAAGTGAVTAATLVITHFEGDRHTAYRDSGGIPTICYGHTQGVALGQTRTHPDCEQLLRADLTQAFAVVNRHVTVPLPEPRRAALASFVHNFGETKFARSTLLRRINAGEGARACRELSRWIYGIDNTSHGRKRIQPGLVKRRRIERQLCEMQP